MDQGTVVIVSFRSEDLDLSWLPEGAPVIIVHNDDCLDRGRVTHSPTRHVGDGSNVGFGAGVNLALPLVDTSRTILVNPDIQLGAPHWDALSRGTPSEVVTIPLKDASGAWTSVVNRFPTPLTTVLTALRLGRFVRRDSKIRLALSPLLGRWGADHAASLAAHPGVTRWAATTHWASAAAVSYPTALLREVGGFDPGYFLYLEDVDLGRRLAVVAPQLEIVLAQVGPGIHVVSASSATISGRRRADLEQARSASRYAATQAGTAWAASRFVVGLLARWRARRR